MKHTTTYSGLIALLTILFSILFSIMPASARNYGDTLLHSDASLTLRTAGQNKLEARIPSGTVRFEAGRLAFKLENGDRFAYTFGSKTLPETVADGAEVWYHSVYPQVDLRCYIKVDGKFGYDWIVHPGGDPQQIAMTVEAGSVSLSGGLLELGLAASQVQASAPYSYQGANQMVKSQYVVNGKTVGFDVLAYDASKTLIIDPTAVENLTCIGGDINSLVDVDVKASGVYFAGFTDNNSFSLPVSPGALFPSGFPLSSYYIGAVDPDLGTSILGTYFPIPVTDVEATSDGSVFFAATSGSSGQTAPTTTNHGFYAGSTQTPYIGKLKADGTALDFGTYLGGNSFVSITDVEVHDDHFYVLGTELGNASNVFPITAGAFQETNLNANARQSFLMVFNCDGDVIYGTYLSSANGDVSASALTIAADGSIFITGSGRINNQDVTHPTFSSGNGFIMELNPLTSLGAGAADLVYLTKAPARNGDIEVFGDQIYIMTVPKSRANVINNVGQPIVGTPLEASGNGNYMACIDRNSYEINASTYIPGFGGRFSSTTGSGGGLAQAIGTTTVIDFEIDKCGRIILFAGASDDDAIITPDGAFTSTQNSDLYVALLDSSLSTVIASSYLGSSYFDVPVGMELAADGSSFYVAGTALSAPVWTAVGPTGQTALNNPINVNLPSTPGSLNDCLSFIGHDANTPFLGEFTLPPPVEKPFVCQGSPTVLDVVSECLAANAASVSWIPYNTTGTLTAPDSISNDDSLTPTVSLSADTTFLLIIEDEGGNTLFSEQITVCVVPNASGIAGPDKYICISNCTVIGSAGYADLSYTWSPSTGLSDPTSATPLACPEVSTTYTLSYIDCDGIQQVDSVYIGVDVDPNEIPDFTGEDQYVCVGDDATLGAYIEGSFAYDWSPADDLDNPFSANPVVLDVQGDQLYTVVIRNLCNGLSATGTVNVGLNPDVANAGPDIPTCPDEPLIIGNPSNANLLAYTWTFVDPATPGTIVNPNSSNPELTFTVAGRYEVQLEAVSACGVSTDTMDVVVFADPIANAGPDRFVCVDWPEAPGTRLPAEIGTPGVPNASYSWSPTDYLESATNAETLVNLPLSITEPITYTLTITNFCDITEVTTDTVTIFPPTNCPMVDAYDADWWALYDLNCDPLLEGADDNILPKLCYDGRKWLGMEPRPDTVYWWEPTDYLEPYTPWGLTNINQSVVYTRAPVEMTYTLYGQDICSGLICSNQVTVIPQCGPGGGEGGGNPPPPPPPPPCEAGEDIVIVCDEDTIQLGEPGDETLYTYTWFPTNDLSDANVAQPMLITPQIGRTYTLTVVGPLDGPQEQWRDCVDQIEVVVRPSPIANAGIPAESSCAGGVIDYVLGPADPSIYANPNWVYSWSPATGLNSTNILNPTIIGPDVASQYSLTVTDPEAGCSTTAQIEFAFAPSFEIDPVGGTACKGVPLQIGQPPLDDGSTYVYAWTPSTGLDDATSSQPIATPNRTTVYTFSATRDQGTDTECELVAAVTVEVVQAVSPNVGSDIEATCAGEAVTIGANEANTNATFSWAAEIPAYDSALLNPNDPTTGIDLSVIPAGSNATFWLTITTIENGCVSSGSVEVARAPEDAPTITTTQSDYNGCADSTVLFSGITITPSDDQATITWTSVQDPNLDFLNPDDSLTPSVIVQDVPLTYTLTVENECGGLTTNLDFTVVEVTPPTLQPIPDVTACADQCQSLSVTANGLAPFTYQWSPITAINTDACGGGSANSDTVNIQVSEDTVINLTVSDVNGCRVSTSILVTVSAPAPDLGQDLIVCANEPTVIGMPNDPAFTYTWSVISGEVASLTVFNTSEVTVNPSIDTTYQLIMDDPNDSCPGATDTVSLVISAEVPVQLPATNIVICPEVCTNIGWKLPEGFEYTWSPPLYLDNPGSENPLFCPDGNDDFTASYNLIVFNPCNPDAAVTNVFSVTVKAAPVADAGTDKTACAGGSVTIGSDAVPGYSYSWSPASRLSSASVANPTITAPSNLTAPVTYTYTLTVDDGNGCPVTDTVKVEFNPVPRVKFPSNYRTCYGSPIQLNGNISGVNNYIVQWSPTTGLDDATSANPILTPELGTSTYTVTVYAVEGGCPAEGIVTILADEPSLTVAGDNVCLDDSSLLTAFSVPGSIIQWTDPNGSSSTGSELAINPVAGNDFGTYSVTATTPGGCIISNSVVLFNQCTCDLAATVVSTGECVYADGESTSSINVELTWVDAPPGDFIDLFAPLGQISINPASNTSPMIVSVPVPANSSGLWMITKFRSATDCDDLVYLAFPDPCAPCDLELISAVAAPCVYVGDASMSTVTVTVAYSNAPAGDTITVMVDGISATLTPTNVSGTQSIDVAVPANASTAIVSAAFSTIATCADNGTVVLPEACAPCDLSFGILDPGTCIFDGSMSITTASVDVAWNNAPSGEDIIVTIGSSVATVTVATVSGSATITATLPADGSTIALSANFATTVACSDSANLTLPEACDPPPPAPCDLAFGTLDPGTCIFDGSSSITTASVDVAWSNAPSGEDIIVTIGSSVATVTVATVSGSATITATLPADGSTIALSANFATTVACSDSANLTLPEACDPPPPCDLAFGTLDPGTCIFDGSSSITTASVDVAWSNAPSGEDIIVTIGSSVATVTVATVSGSATITATLPADGSTIALSANFATTVACSDSANITLPEACDPPPPAPCDLAFGTLNPGTCIFDGSSSITTASVDVAWSNAPSGEDIIVTIGSSVATVTVATVSGSATITATLPADGSTIALSANFATTVACSDSANLTLPEACDPPPPPPPCELLFTDSEAGPCAFIEGSSVSTVQVTIAWSNAPAGQDILVSFGTTTVTVTPSNSQGTQTLSQVVPADGSTLALSASFSVDATCADQSSVLLTGPCIVLPPEEPCDLTIDSATAAPCRFEAGQSISTVTIAFTWENPPAGEDIVFQLGSSSVSFTPASVTGSSTVTLTVPANGAINTVQGAFETATFCEDSADVTLPEACEPPPCALDLENIVIGDCFYDNDTSMATVSVTIAWSDATIGDTINVSVAGVDGSFAVTTAAGSAEYAQVVIADGSDSFISATFAGDSACANVAPISLPAACKPLIFDLALLKALATGQAAVVNPGDTVDFTITVYNQGEIPATNVVVTDYIPAGFTLADTDWSLNANGDATTTVNGVILPGDDLSVDITLEIDADFEGQAINYAEITDDNSATGDVDSTPDDEDRNTETNVVNDVTDNTDGDEDDHDPEVITVVTEPIFDLALRKELAVGQAPLVAPGSIVTFTITVFNQGEIDAHEIVITEHLPTGLVLFDSDWTSVDASTATYTIAGPITPGSSQSVDVTVQVDASFTGDALNIAEISDAQDADGNHPEDIDSKADGDKDNDGSYTDDEIDNRNGDEDDHDPALLQVGIFDLALIKIVSINQQTPIRRGDLVTYTITVFNQGTIPATDVVVTDYTPNGMTLADSDWTAVAGGAETTLIGTIAPGGQRSVDITLQVNADAVGPLENVAEITQDNGPIPDADSTPDSNPDNDGPYTDNAIDGENGDEDDHDPAVIDLLEEVFDLALRKMVAPGTAEIIQRGDFVDFVITLFNQGNVTAYDIQVIDYIPSGFRLADSDWISVSADKALITVPGPLAPGAPIDVTITLEIINGGGDLVNFAEILVASDAAGGTPREDIDSIPDEEKDNDGTVVDNEINNTNGDQDDHDPAPIRVAVVSLGDYVWLDSNADGQQDSNESGVEGVTVYLLDANGNRTGESTVTDSTGFYEFTLLPFGTYAVEFDLSTLPSSHAPSPQNSGNDNSDSDADPNTGITHQTTLTTDGQRDPSLDMGIYPLGTIDGTLWIDLSNDGVPFDEALSSLGIAGVPVRVYEIINGERIFLRELVTDANGEFCFMDIPAGTYAVEYDFSDVPVGDMPLEAATPTSYVFEVEPGERVKDNYFAVIPTPTAIELKSFEITRGPAGMQIDWVTASEANTLGFKLYRSATADGERQAVSSLILAENNISGSAYSFVDAAAPAGNAFYWLEELELDLSTELYGPFASDENEDDAPLASYDIENPGIYLVMLDQAEQAGVKKQGTEIPTHLAHGGLVFYTGTAGEVEVIQTATPKRMAMSYAEPRDDHEVAILVADKGAADVETQSAGNILVDDVSEQNIVLDISDKANPVVLEASVIETLEKRAAYFYSDGERVIKVRDL